MASSSIRNYLNRFVGSENNTSFEGSYNTWQEADALCNCYDIGDILEKVLPATLKVKNCESDDERNYVIFDQIEY